MIYLGPPWRWGVMCLTTSICNMTVVDWEFLPDRLCRLLGPHSATVQSLRLLCSLRHPASHGRLHLLVELLKESNGLSCCPFLAGSFCQEMVWRRVGGRSPLLWQR